MLLTTDSFDHYTNPLDKYSAFLRATNTAGGIAGSVGRGGGGAFNIASNAAGGVCGLQRNIVNSTTVIAGFAIKVNTYPTVSSGNLALLSYINGGGALIEARMDNTGVIQFTKNGTNIGSAGTTPVPFSAYHYLELKTTISNVSGVVECRLDNTVILSDAALNTGSGGITAVVLGPGTVGPGTINGGSVYIDDYYLVNITVDGGPTSYLGDVQIKPLYATGAGAFTNFARGGTDTGANFSQTNETSPDGDTTYVFSSTVGDRDSYKFTALAVTGAVFGINLFAYAEKTQSGARSISMKARSGSVDSADINLPLATSYTYVNQFLPTDPATSGPWTTSSINAAEFGPKVTV